MNKQKIEIILTMGNDTEKAIVHIMAARAFVSQNPQIVNPETPSELAVVTNAIHSFKSKFPLLCVKKLTAMVNNLLRIKASLFLPTEYKSPLSLITPDESLASMLDIISKDTQLCKIAELTFMSKA